MSARIYYFETVCSNSCNK